MEYSATLLSGVLGVKYLSECAWLS